MPLDCLIIISHVLSGDENKWYNWCHKWISTRLWHIKCLCTGDTAVLNWAGIIWLYSISIVRYIHCSRNPWVLQLPYSIPQEIGTRFLLCCALLWLYIDWFSHIHQAYFTGTVANLTIAPVPTKQPWWIWINTSCEFIMNDYITTTKQSTTKLCAYFLGYTVGSM